MPDSPDPRRQRSDARSDQAGEVDAAGDTAGEVDAAGDPAGEVDAAGDPAGEVVLYAAGRLGEVIRPRLRCVTIETRRVAEMIAWYTTVVGSFVVSQAGGVTWLGLDGAGHQIALIEAEAEPTADHNQCHFSFEYESVDDLLDTYLRLWGGGITPVVALDYGPAAEFLYADPDGNLVGLIYTNSGGGRRSPEERLASWDWSPRGIPVDPAALVEARKAGMSPMWTHERTRGTAGEGS